MKLLNLNKNKFDLKKKFVNKKTLTKATAAELIISFGLSKEKYDTFTSIYINVTDNRPVIIDNRSVLLKCQIKKYYNFHQHFNL